MSIKCFQINGSLKILSPKIGKKKDIKKWKCLHDCVREEYFWNKTVKDSIYLPTFEVKTPYNSMYVEFPPHTPRTTGDFFPSRIDQTANISEIILK